MQSKFMDISETNGQETIWDYYVLVCSWGGDKLDLKGALANFDP